MSVHPYTDDESRFGFYLETISEDRNFKIKHPKQKEIDFSKKLFFHDVFEVYYDDLWDLLSSFTCFNNSRIFYENGFHRFTYETKFELVTGVIKGFWEVPQL